MNTSISVVLYTSKTLSNGEHPLMLRLTKERKRKYISLHLSLNASFWDFSKGRPKRNCPDKDNINALIDLKIKEYQQQVLDFKTNDKDYTLSTLIRKASNHTIKRTVGEYLDLYTTQLIFGDPLNTVVIFGADLAKPILNKVGAVYIQELPLWAIGEKVLFQSGLSAGFG